MSPPGSTMDSRRWTGGRLQPMVLSSGPSRPPSPLTKWQRPQSWRAYSSRPASGSPVSAISAGARSERTKATICHISLSDRRTDGMPVFGMPLRMFMKIARSLLPWRNTSRVRSGPRSPWPSAPWQWSSATRTTPLPPRHPLPRCTDSCRRRAGRRARRAGAGPRPARPPAAPRRQRKATMRKSPDSDNIRTMKLTLRG